jgi:hypothetical protein
MTIPLTFALVRLAQEARHGVPIVAGTDDIRVGDEEGQAAGSGGGDMGERLSEWRERETHSQATVSGLKVLRGPSSDKNRQGPRGAHTHTHAPGDGACGKGVEFGALVQDAPRPEALYLMGDQSIDRLTWE